jgi:ssDNA-binding replication factor A large subunit
LEPNQRPFEDGLMVDPSDFGSKLADTRSTYTPIKSLNTFLFDWKIKARVTKKHQKKAWKNQRGHGSLLNIELIDSAGT